MKMNKQMKTILPLAALAGLSMAGTASAVLVSADLNAGGADTGFSGGWVGSNNVFISAATDLTYANYSIGQTGTPGNVYAANTAHPDRMDSRNLAASMSGDIWFSALVNVTSGSNFAGLSFAKDLYTGGVNRYSHALSELRVVLTPSSLIVDMNGGSPPTATGTETGSFAADTTHLILGQMTVGIGNDTLNVWIDPDVITAGGPGGLGAANFTSTTVDFMDEINKIGVPISWNGSSSPHVDALRYSDTLTAFTDVTGVTPAAIPEPSTTALLGLGGLALVFRRRK
jgi:hypothetical protein